MTAPEILERKAQEWRAVGLEHTSEGDPMRLFYVAIEVCLRELAQALEQEREAL